MSGRQQKESRMKKVIRGALFRLFGVALGILATFLGFSALQVGLFKFVDPPFTASMAGRYAASKFGGKEYAVRYRWKELDAISPHLRRAVLAAEDQRFPEHCGFDWVELKKAAGEALSGGRLRGASTISMQAARSLFLWPGRNLLRKGLEAWYTVLMELFWSKARILEMYLNTVDWGDDIVGAQAAAGEYYRRDASRLNRWQAAMLAAVLPNPHRWSPNRPTRYVVRRQHRILKDMKMMKLVGD
jgi:monofunctional biosynthetic peptidoglycan transglycosylase